MRFPWKRPDRATLQITVLGAGILGLGLGSGIIIGAELEPPQIVEIRSTVTLATPPACKTALNAAFTAFDQTETRDIQNGYNLQQAAVAFDKQIHGKVKEMFEAQELSNEAAINRDTADLERSGAEQSARENGALCFTHVAPIRITERISK